MHCDRLLGVVGWRRGKGRENGRGQQVEGSPCSFEGLPVHCCSKLPIPHSKERRVEGVRDWLQAVGWLGTSVPAEVPAEVPYRGPVRSCSQHSTTLSRNGTTTAHWPNHPPTGARSIIARLPIGRSRLVDARAHSTLQRTCLLTGHGSDKCSSKCKTRVRRAPRTSHLATPPTLQYGNAPPQSRGNTRLPSQSPSFCQRPGQQKRTQQGQQGSV